MFVSKLPLLVRRLSGGHVTALFWSADWVVATLRLSFGPQTEWWPRYGCLLRSPRLFAFNSGTESRIYWHFSCLWFQIWQYGGECNRNKLLVRIYRRFAYLTRLEVRQLVTSCAWSYVNPPYIHCCTGCLFWASSSKKLGSSSVVTVTVGSNSSVPHRLLLDTCLS
jgi:hypothetical protein